MQRVLGRRPIDFPYKKRYNDWMPFTTQNYTLAQFADLLQLETQLGIVDGQAVMQMLMKDGKLPREIKDVRGALRLVLARAENGEDLAITTYPTALSREHLLCELAA